MLKESAKALLPATVKKPGVTSCIAGHSVLALRRSISS